jgi:feruloyl esterase
VSIGACLALTWVGAAGAQPLRGPAGPEDFPGSELRCSRLAGLELPDLIGIEATVVDSGAFEIPPQGPAAARPVDLPAHCRIVGTVRPAIRFEVWLPFADQWNSRFQAVGGGGLAGVISYGAMARALVAGYATASTDTGHTADDVEWLADPRLLRDYGYRAIFEMTANAKALIRSFYDRAADFDYFIGCSTGGRQGLMEAQRFPDDYDGIVAGAPVNDFVDIHIAQLWTALASKPATDEPLLGPADLELVTSAVLAQCDALDGVTDGLIEDPRVCPFDPGALQCGPGQSGTCLATDQVEAVRRIYAGPADPATGGSLHPGFARGGESAWSIATAPGLVTIPQAFFSRAVFDDPDWDWHSFDFAEDVSLARGTTSHVLDATDPDLADFQDRGGKLIVYHGWNDQGIPPEGSIAYREAVETALVARNGGVRSSADDFFRLFMVPGMTHCRGGPGADTFDVVSAIEDWVERDIAPDRIDARHAESGNNFSRALCPYPLTARYRGSGDTSRAESYVCAR